MYIIKIRNLQNIHFENKLKYTSFFKQFISYKNYIENGPSFGGIGPLAPRAVLRRSFTT